MTKLSDAWMKRVVNDDLALLKLEPIGIAYLGLIAVGWGVGAVANAESGGRRSETVALVAASAASAGMLTASLLAGDRYARRKAETISILFEGVMAGTAELVLAGHARCRHDCEVLFTSVGVAVLATTASALLMELLLPPVWASQQDEHYRSLSGSARVTFARDLLLRRDDVARKRLYCNWALSTASAAIFAAAIPLANGTRTRIELGVLAGAMLLTSSIGLIVGLVERRPSEQLMQGVLPPPD